jgi:hypothetical protein
MADAELVPFRVGHDVGVDVPQPVDVAELVAVLPQRIAGGVVGGVYVAGFDSAASRT